MKIETKFSVNDLVKHKFDTDADDTVQLLEVMEVQTQTCYAGTQNFYVLRPIVATKKYKDKWNNSGEFNWVIGHGISKEVNQIGWQKYREDELKKCPYEICKIIMGK